jgi:DNA mismatch repair protein MutH
MSAASATAAAVDPVDDGPSILERFKETSAYERLSKEAGSLGDRLVEELSTTAQQVVLPALLKKIKNWVGLDLSDRTPSMSGQADRGSTYDAASDARN